ncbi:MAG: hypothetical protein Q9191_002453 [Dirinaria sp. TL-2023a]
MTQVNALPARTPNARQLPRLTPRQKPSRPNPQPVPEAPPLPSPSDDARNIGFTRPTRRVLSSHDHELFQSSPTYTLILSFIFSLSDAAADKKISSITHNSAEVPIIRQILAILSDIDAVQDSCPAAEQGGSRFGNPAFRVFLDTLSTQSPRWHESLGVTDPQAEEELSAYLLQSFGDRARIDYGSGHELNFIVWLLCLNRLSLLPESELAATALVLFPRYVRLMRKLQTTYYLEPAGSQGVWGLDDYHFLPFLFGASQLLHHPYIRPMSIHNENVLEEEGDEYLYLDMVRWTMASKTVKGLKWTQPMLDDISGAKSWEKVEQGMRRMFVKEVLGKLPVMQHFLFGGLIPAAASMGRQAEVGLDSRTEEIEDDEHAAQGRGGAHVHRNDAWGECCGIKIPSMVAAAEEGRKQRSEQLRRVPFD